MKDKIYTIPITEAFSTHSFCPFCTLENKIEEEEIKYALGPAMMEPDYREISNVKGFCKNHIIKLNTLPKALSMSLVLDTHIEYIDSILNKDIKNKSKTLFKKNNKSDIEMLSDKLNEITNSCTICDRINHTVNRYIETFVYMLKTDKDFVEIVLKSKGFCIMHYAKIISCAKGFFNENEFHKFLSGINEIQKNKLSEIKNDLKNFIDSFDYKNANKPIKAPSDSVLKASYLLNGEFEPPKKKLNDI